MQPAHTAVRYAFQASESAWGEQAPIAVQEVLRRMDALNAYTYLHEVAARYFERKGIERVTPAELERLLSRIDREMTADSEPADWARLLGPLFALARVIPDQQGVPAPTLAAFFEARGRSDLAQRFAEAEGDLVEEAVIDRLAAPAERRETPRLAPPRAPERYAAQGARPLWQRYLQAEGEVEEIHARLDGTAEPPAARGALWERFSAPPAAPPDPAPAEVEREAAAPPPDSPPDASDPARLDAEAEGDSLDALERRLLGSVTEDRRALYVNNLMSGSEEDYAAVLRHLDAAEDWTAASKVIAREVFRRHGVNIYSEAAVSFTDAVESRFSR